MTFKPKLLFSYHFIRKSPAFQRELDALIASQTCEILIDSGAFSAFTTKQPIDFDDYCEYVARPELAGARYFMLDVIGDPAKTDVNLQRMLERGLKPIPILTPGQPYSRLNEYFDVSDVVATGGLTNKSGAPMQRIMRGVKHYAAGRKMHLLGFTSMQGIRQYRPYSCDSSSWRTAGRFGRLVSFRNGTITYYPRRKVRDGFPQHLIDDFERWEIPWRDLQHVQAWDAIGHQLNAIAWLRASAVVEKHVGTKLFLALSSHRHLEFIHGARERSWTRADGSFRRTRNHCSARRRDSRARSGLRSFGA